MNKPVQTSELDGAASKGPRLVLFVEDGGGDWHARRLRKALEARGATVVTTTLAACAFDTPHAVRSRYSGLRRHAS